MSDRMRDELIALEAVKRTITSVSTGDGKSIGGIADEAVAYVEQVCAEGRLGIEIGLWRRDPDRGRP